MASPKTIAIRDMFKDHTYKVYPAEFYKPAPKQPSRRGLHRQEVAARKVKR